MSVVAGRLSPFTFWEWTSDLRWGAVQDPESAQFCNSEVGYCLYLVPSAGLSCFLRYYSVSGCGFGSNEVVVRVQVA